MRVSLALFVLTITVGLAPSLAQSDPAAVGALIRDVQGRDFDRAYAAAEKLRRYPAQRAQIVPALIQAIATREWDRCSADARDAIARTLGDLKAREAVTPLLDLVKTGKPIEHECFE
jgi:HEAT repeat protein